MPFFTELVGTRVSSKEFGVEQKSSLLEAERTAAQKSRKYEELQRQAAALLKGETDLTHLESLVRLLP